MVTSSPLTVQYVRGGHVESEHIVDAAIVDSAGKMMAIYGDVERPIFPRSSIKPLQAITMVESGLIEKYGLQDKHISMACASHAGERLQTKLVEEWLGRMGLSEQVLECGPHLPSNPEAAKDFICTSHKPGPLQNNCSGKHTGFLGACLMKGFATKGYAEYEHPFQLEQRRLLGELYEEDLSKAPWGVDGCGIPTYAVPLKALALASAKLLPDSRLKHSHRQAMDIILRAIANEPYMIAGTDKYCSRLPVISGSKVIAKVGADGVFLALALKKSLGIALKVRSGSSPAAEYALTTVLGHFGALTEAESSLLHSDRLTNWAGREVGYVRVVGLKPSVLAN